MSGRRTKTDDERFSAKVDKRDGDGCWLWVGASHPLGYGVFRIDCAPGTSGRLVRAHRWSFERIAGPILKGLVLDHLCRTPACVNPWHLEAVTHKVNMERGEWARKTHCPAGHEYSEENTIRRAGRGRECRECVRRLGHIRNRRFRDRMREGRVS